MEIEKREGANRTSTSTNPSQTGPTGPTARSSIGKNEVCQIQLGPFEPELSITPALASLVEHQNFHPSPIAPTHGVTSPSAPSLEYALEHQKFSPAVPPPRPHSTRILGYHYPPPSSLSPSILSPNTSSVQYTPDISTPTTSYFAPPLPPRPHSAHIPDHQPSAPNSSTTISSVEQQEGCEAPPLPPRPKQHRPIQRQDSGYYSNPPSRHSSTFSNTSLSTCCSPQPMLSPVSTGLSFLSPQTTGQSLRHSVSYGSTSPMSSPPTSYFPPPPPSPIAKPLSQVKDYFSRSLARSSSQTPAYRPGISQPAHAPPQYQGSQGSQGWQWGTAPLLSNGQPQYGAPPSIPNAWKGS